MTLESGISERDLEIWGLLSMDQLYPLQLAEGGLPRVQLPIDSD